MQLRHVALVGLLLTAGCHDKAKEASQAAAAKSAEEAEIDKRSKAIAQDLVQKATEEAEKKRATEAQHKLEARQDLQKVTMAHPGSYLESSNLQMVEVGKRHLTSLSLKNNAKFSMSDIRGTVDYHGGVGADAHGNNNDVLAQVPVELTGAIAPGASMVFSEDQHTLSGAAIQLTKAPTSVTFTVTSAKVGSEGLDAPAPPRVADAGADGGPDAGGP